MIHKRLVLGNLVRRYPLSGMNPATDLSFPYAGPLIPAYSHQVRAEAVAAGINLGPPVPTDLCLWNLGESRSREVTKIGGVPYWPADAAWPVTVDEGEPTTFVAQFCFADSKDILPSLPGEILSIHALDETYIPVYYFWFDLGLRQTPPRKLPKPRWELTPFHASLLRTVDHPKAQTSGTPRSWEFFGRYPSLLGVESKICRFASKIGGAWLSGADIPYPSSTDDPSLKAKYRRWRRADRRQANSHIAQLMSVCGTAQRPFVNVTNSADLRADGRAFLCISDLGGYSFFFDGKKTYDEWRGN